MSKDNGGAAFPGALWGGMSLRDYFAAALQGMLAAPMGKFSHQENAQLVVNDAFSIADAMLATRK